MKPQEEAELVALAQAKGLSADALVRVALDKFLAESSGEISLNEPAHSLCGLLAKYGPAPSVEAIDENALKCSRIFLAPIIDDRRHRGHAHNDLLSFLQLSTWSSSVCSHRQGRGERRAVGVSAISLTRTDPRSPGSGNCRDGIVARSPGADARSSHSIIDLI